MTKGYSPRRLRIPRQLSIARCRQLSISRSIIDAHGGRLWAEPNEPRGAVFQFTLPGAENEVMNSLEVSAT
jgi:hypothetical protein